MLKYMKYELKGTYRFMLAIILAALFATSSLQLYGKNLTNGNNLSEPSVFGGIFIGLMIFVVFGAFIATIFYLIGNFRKDLYEDRGYLTFTLPISGSQILGAKTIIALMWAALLVFSFITYNFLLVGVLYGEDVINVIVEGLRFIANNNLNGVIIAGFLVAIFSVITTLLLIYFSIALSRVSIGNKKIGGVWVVIFLILNSLIAYFSIRIGDLIPYYIDLTNFSIISESDFMRYFGYIESQVMGHGYNPGMVVSSSEMIAFNIGSLIFNVLTTVGIFLGTSYIIEKKVDL
ncbi:MAG: hypothetical protein GX231_04020 [Tissierellia bacterium]|nr:hypothetical protein [Tissierellia bacterium]